MSQGVSSEQGFGRSLLEVKEAGGCYGSGQGEQPTPSAQGDAECSTASTREDGEAAS